MINNFLINNFLAQEKYDAKVENIYSDNELVKKKARTIDLGMTGYVEGAIYETAFQYVNVMPDTKKRFSAPIALTFGVDYGYTKDNIVLSMIGYTANYSKEIHYEELVINPSKQRGNNKDANNAWVVMCKVFSFLEEMKMPIIFRIILLLMVMLKVFVMP